jgi:hypothetical protein
MSGTSRARDPAEGDRFVAVESYFNYFTEIEECYQRSRGTRTLLSPIDWALIESWKEAGVPLEAILLGIERSFEKFKKRPARIQKINSLAYCSQLVMSAAQEMGKAASGGDAGGARAGGKVIAAPFTPGEIVEYLHRNLAALDQAAEVARSGGQKVLAEDISALAATLGDVAERESAGAASDLEELERCMTVLEEKLTASLTRASSVELLTGLRQEVEQGLAPYRRKMTTPQVESLERQLMKKRLFEHYRIPRLSLFYL